MKINKEELYQKYMVEKLSQRDVARHFGVTVQTVWNNCKKHGFERSAEENYLIGTQGARKAWAEDRDAILEKMTKSIRAVTLKKGDEMKANRKRTMQERYGVDYVSLLPKNFKVKSVSKNFKKIEVQVKAQATLRKKYGEGGPLGNPEVRAKINKTNGGTSAFCREDVKNKVKETNLERYGVDNVFKSADIQESIRNTMKENGYVSKGEAELFSFIKNLFPDAVQGNYSVLKNRELDIYIPSKDIAIEYNGEYWHSDNRIAYDRDITIQEARRYHYQKYLDCKQQGIQLIYIWESEWLNKTAIWKNKLKSILGVSDAEIIYARNCTVRNISVKEKMKFLNENHIQGNDRCSESFGMFHKERLVAVMTFRKSRDNKEIELSRYATSAQIPGGFSKMLKHSEYNNITSWSDNRLSAGNMYEKSGWVKVQENRPDYMVFLNKQLHHKSSFRKASLKKKFPEHYDEELTEWEIEDNIPNCYRIWDCGKTKWQYKS